MSLPSKFFLIFILGSYTLQASVHNINGENQRVFYVGTSHCYEPHDAQYSTLLCSWNTFLKETNGKDCQVAIEQPTIPAESLPSFDQAIKKGADWAAALYLAQQATIPVIAADPLVRKAFQLLAASTTWATDLVHYACFIQYLAFYNRLQATENKPQLPILESVERSVRTIFPDSNLENMIALHEKLTGRTFNPYDHHFFEYVIAYPPFFSLRGTLLYRFDALPTLRDIMRHYHMYRDAATLAVIKKAILDKKNLFIVYGKAHEQTHLKALEGFMKEAAS